MNILAVVGVLRSEVESFLVLAPDRRGRRGKQFYHQPGRNQNHHNV
ncbi:MAG: hypothetical protein KIS67_13225 [Verrucomicrobiae bacterium]|nr:hypothetical protein [Verrucomicrobiae bacterium]